MTPRNLALTAFVIGPVAAGVDMLASYYLVYPAQASGSKLALHVMTIACALVAFVAILMSRRALVWKGGTAEGTMHTEDVDRFLAIAALTLNLFWLLLILGFAVPKIILHVSD